MVTLKITSNNSVNRCTYCDSPILFQPRLVEQSAFWHILEKITSDSEEFPLSPVNLEMSRAFMRTPKVARKLDTIKLRHVT